MIKIARNSFNNIKNRFNIIKSDDNRTLVNLIYKYLKNEPYFFIPFGKVKRLTLEKELRQYDFNFPDELINVWLEFGGGEFWETENILYPISSEDDLIEKMIIYNQNVQENNFNKRYFIFASDTVELVAFEKKNHSIKIFRSKEEDYQIEAEFNDIIEWFNSIFWEQYNYVSITKELTAKQ